MNSLVPDTTVTWTWTNGSQSFTQTTAVNSAGIAAIVMPVGVPGSYTITAVGYTTGANGQPVQVTRTGTAVVTEATVPTMAGTTIFTGKSKAKWQVTLPAGVTCAKKFKYRIEYKKKKSWDAWKRYDWTYYTGLDHVVVVTRKRSLGNGWYRAVVRGKCGVPGFVTTPVYLTK